MTPCAHFAQLQGRKPMCLIGRTPELDCCACPAYQPGEREPRDVWTDEQRDAFFTLRSTHDE